MGSAVDMQVFFNIMVALIGFLGGWVLNHLRDSIKSIQVENDETNKTVHRIEVLVAGEYVKKDELAALMAGLVVQLTRIENKMDSKADKH